METTTAFIDALTEFDITFKANSRSIIIETCPACSRKNKLWMFRPDERKCGGRTGGMCWRCGTKFSSYTLLTAFGVPPKDARRALYIGQNSPDLDPNTWDQIPDFQTDEEEIKQVVELEKTGGISIATFGPEIVPLSELFRILAPHPITDYCKKRGLLPPLVDLVFADLQRNAVCFPVMCEDYCVGLQKRFLNFVDIKTHTSPSVPKSRSFIKVGNPNDPICVVEGPFDAVAAAWMGFYGICTMGSEVSTYQVQEIALMAAANNNSTVYIGFDQDVAGEKGARKVAKHLDALGVSFIRIFPKDKDSKDLNSQLTSIYDTQIFPIIQNLSPEKLIKIETDWMWDLPSTDDLAFLEEGIGLTKSKFGKYRAYDTKKTNDYNWQNYRYKKNNFKKF